MSIMFKEICTNTHTHTHTHTHIYIYIYIYIYKLLIVECKGQKCKVMLTMRLHYFDDIRIYVCSITDIKHTLSLDIVNYIVYI